MEPTTRRRVLARAVPLLLVLNTVPQLLRMLLHLLIEGIAEGADGGLLTALSTAADFLGAVSFFAGLGAAIRLTLCFGLKKGGMWLVPVGTLYGVTLIAFQFFGRVPWQAAFAVFGFTAVLTVFLFLWWQKDGRGAAALIAGSLGLAIPGGLIALLTAAPTVSELVGGLFYGLTDFCLVTLVLAAAVRLANALRERAPLRGRGGPKEKRCDPFFAAVLVADGLYTLISVLSALPDLILEVREYGLPVNGGEWITLLWPFGKCLLFFLLGVLVMPFVSRRLVEDGAQVFDD